MSGILAGNWDYDAQSWNHGWYFYPEEGGFFYLPAMEYIATIEKQGKPVALLLQLPEFNAVVLPALPDGVDLTKAINGYEGV